VKGLAFDWQRMYGENRPRRISLPTYPFARERYWAEIQALQPMHLATGGILHPLLHRNTSSFSVQRFSTRFSGEEFFLADHVVRGMRVLPGVAQLEMACQAAGKAIDEPCRLQLKNVAWMRPLTVDADGLDVQIALVPRDAGDIGFEIFSNTEDGDAVLYSQGSVIAGAVMEADAKAVHDLAALRQQCNVSQMSDAQCYALFEQMGLHYGHAFRNLVELFVGSRQVLARIALPTAMRMDDYVLHPGLLDAALQAAIGLTGMADGSAEPALWLPVGLRSLDVLAPCTSRMWAFVRPSGGTVDDASQVLDVDLCDEAGVVCVRLGQLELRVSATLAESGTAWQTLLARPMWEVQLAGTETTSGRAFARHVVLLCGLAATDADRVQARMPEAVCVTLAANQDLASAYAAAAETLLEQVQSLNSQPGQHLIQVAVPGHGKGLMMMGLVGMLRTAQRENPRIVGQLISVEAGQDVAKALHDDRHGDESQLRYVDGIREVSRWTELTDTTAENPPWRAQGVYLITGGAGGLGLIFAREIARQATGATLILTGRSSRTESIEARLAELEALGAAAHYRQLDVGDRDAVVQCLRETAETFGALHGILHSAGVLRDSFMLKKTREELHAVLNAKVAGTLHLDEASRDMPLDCFICFSSLAGVLGNLGQADYAAANAFMDAFAHHRAELVAQGQRRGRTLSVNWPLWDEGGMQVDAATRQYLLQETGMAPLRSASGCAALAHAWSSGLPQVLVVEGRLDRLRATLLKEASSQPEAAAAAPDDAPPIAADLHEQTVRHLVRLLSGTFKLPAHMIDANSALEAYGIDSVMVMDLTLKLERSFGPLPKTLFFEYQSINALADYFLQNHHAGLIDLLGDKPAVVMPVPAARPHGKQAGVSAIRHRSRFDWCGADARANEIAIIGLSGRYPQAGNLEEFW
ncbi:SDR family NAD(P)-dependent oxidoreductase, partial [Dyella sp. S184]|uniref:SDR family NAD(P)-dependent oxidoreductase n=1 Tax=Dyella sp. S184 TaxID=1641862 RepID=UPI00131D8BE7